MVLSNSAQGWQQEEKQGLRRRKLKELPLEDVVNKDGSDNHFNGGLVWYQLDGGLALGNRWTTWATRIRQKGREHKSNQRKIREITANLVHIITMTIYIMRVLKQYL